MKLRTAKRTYARIRIALQGPSGSGKTYSALQLAYGLCQDWTKICVIDTENGSADLYSHLGNYQVLQLSQPFTPERYVQALKVCEESGSEVIIIDSASHEWDGSGGILDEHGTMTGNSFTNWSKVTPRHNMFIQAILNSKSHIIATLRSKQDYVINEKNGRSVPEKVGLKAIQRDGTDYEFTIAFDIDTSHAAKCSKDRTEMFDSKPPLRIDSSTGQQIREWCESFEPVSQKEVFSRIGECKSVQELLQLYYLFPQYQEGLKEEFGAKKQELRSAYNLTPQSVNHLENQSNEGTSN